jgi:hypothetical protein
MSTKWKILTPIIIISLGFIAKFILFDYVVSNGKRVGNLTKISKKTRFWIFKTWEGTLDEGSGDKLTSYFSVEDEELANQLYEFEGRQVVLYYEQHVLGFPRQTNYNIVSWKPKTEAGEVLMDDRGSSALDLLSKTLFCSLLGAIYTDQELYQKVKNHVKENNLFLFNKISDCNN